MRPQDAGVITFAYDRATNHPQPPKMNMCEHCYSAKRWTPPTSRMKKRIPKAHPTRPPLLSSPSQRVPPPMRSIRKDSSLQTIGRRPCPQPAILFQCPALRIDTARSRPPHQALWPEESKGLRARELFQELQFSEVVLSKKTSQPSHTRLAKSNL